MKKNICVTIQIQITIERRFGLKISEEETSIVIPIELFESINFIGVMEDMCGVIWEKGKKDLEKVHKERP